METKRCNRVSDVRITELEELAQTETQRYIRRPEFDRRAGELGKFEADAWEDTTMAHAGDGWAAMKIVFTNVGTDANALAEAHAKAKAVRA